MAAPEISVPNKNILVTDQTYLGRTVEPFEIGTGYVNNRYDGYLAVDPKNPNHMVGICRRFYGPGEKYQDVLEAQHTWDGGKSWQTSTLPLPRSIYSISDPWIGIAPKSIMQGPNPLSGGNDLVYVIGLAVQPGKTGEQFQGVGVYFYWSADSGRTWPEPSIITFGIWCDQTFGAIDLNSGRLYAIWYDGSLALAYSEDGGHNWFAPSSAKNQPNQYSPFDLGRPEFHLINMAVGPDGVVHIIGMDEQNPPTVWYARSKDGGNTFEYGQIATAQKGSGNIGIIFPPTAGNPSPPSLAVASPPTIFAGEKGTVFAAWSVDVGSTPSNPKPMMRICVASCTDGGNTWINNLANGSAPESVPLLPLGDLPDTPNDHYFRPRLSEGPHGSIGCLFTGCGLVGNKQLLPAEFITCLSVSWLEYKNIFGAVVKGFNPQSTVTVAVSDRPTNPLSTNPVLRWSLPNAYFVGDFLGLVASTLGFFPYWSDTRLGSAQLVTTQITVAPQSPQ